MWWGFKKDREISEKPTEYHSTVVVEPLPGWDDCRKTNSYYIIWLQEGLNIKYYNCVNGYFFGSYSLNEEYPNDDWKDNLKRCIYCVAKKQEAHQFKEKPDENLLSILAKLYSKVYLIKVEEAQAIHSQIMHEVK